MILLHFHPHQPLLRESNEIFYFLSLFFFSFNSIRVSERRLYFPLEGRIPQVSKDLSGLKSRNNPFNRITNQLLCFVAGDKTRFFLHPFPLRHLAPLRQDIRNLFTRLRWIIAG